MLHRSSLALLCFSWLALGSTACMTTEFGKGQGQGDGQCKLGTQDCFCDAAGQCEAGLVCVGDRCEVEEGPVPEGSKTSKADPSPDTSSEGSQGDATPEPGPDTRTDKEPDTDGDDTTEPSRSSADDENSSSEEPSTSSSSSSSPSSSDTQSSSGPAASCKDSVKNGRETDVDCGGPDCLGCANGLRCNVGVDCLSEVCQEGRCVADKPRACRRDVDCRDGNLCTQDRCVNRRCTRSLREDGTKCDDGNKCTAKDRCEAGRCTGIDTRVIDEDFSDPSSVAYDLDFSPPDRFWEVGQAKASRCSTVAGLGEDPAKDHTRDGANGVMGVRVGGCNDNDSMRHLDCAWTRYQDVSFFDNDLHFSFWRYIATPGIKRRDKGPTVRNSQHYRFQGDTKIHEFRSGWPTDYTDRGWDYDSFTLPLSRIKGKGPISFGICYKRTSGSGAFAGWSVDDVLLRQKGCKPNG